VRRVVLASGNAGKLAEMRAILAGHELEVLAQAEFGIEPPPEDADSFAGNALIKARHASARAGLPAIADDSGIEVEALGGRPGLHSARYAGTPANDVANNRKLIEALAGVPAGRRRARYRCAMVFVRNAADPEPVVAEAEWPGRIGFEPRGSGGFGYDQYFLLPDGRTVAELPAAEKNRISHRGPALMLLAARLAAAGW